MNNKPRIDGLWLPGFWYYEKGKTLEISRIKHILPGDLERYVVRIEPQIWLFPDGKFNMYGIIKRKPGDPGCHTMWKKGLYETIDMPTFLQMSYTLENDSKYQRNSPFGPKLTLQPNVAIVDRSEYMTEEEIIDRDYFYFICKDYIMVEDDCNSGKLTKCSVKTMT